MKPDICPTNAKMLRASSVFFVSCSVVMITMGCTTAHNTVERGQFHGSRRFDFGNLLTLEVRSPTDAVYEFKHYNVGGDAFHVPFDRLTITASGGKFVVTDREGIVLWRGLNGSLMVNGTSYRVPLHHLLLIDETGTIRTESGEDRRIISLIPESEAYKYKTH